MNIPVKKIEPLVKELLAVLDDDICYINMSIQRLGQLKAAVIRRNEKELRETMELLENGRSEYEKVEQRRARIRENLAKIFHCDEENLTLTRLAKELSGSLGKQVKSKQTELQQLVSKMKREHTGAIMLLRECAKFNSMLIRTIFGDKKNVTYSSDGSSSWDARRRLVSYKS
jgi:hypothetical protein